MSDRLRMGALATAARLTVKEHAFEFATVALAGGATAVLALVVALHFNSIGVSSLCVASWLGSSPADPECGALLQQFGQVNENEASRVFAAMAALPFGAGLVAGIPLVGRELELRTAQTAWWLEPSRGRWLRRQLIAPTVLLLAAMGLAGTAASVLQGAREAYAPAGAETVTLFGWAVLARTFGAFGVGLFAGALMGRILPALILGSALCAAVFIAVGSIQAQWTQAQAQPIINDEGWHGHAYGIAFVGPTGATYSETVAVAFAPRDAGNPYDWLSAHGYREVELGVSDATASGWISYDISIFVVLGGISTAGTYTLVSRRRPQ